MNEMPTLLIPLRTDRHDGFGYVENASYYCIIRDNKRTALYDKNTNEIVRKLGDFSHVCAVRFFAEHMLMVKTITGKYYLYDIEQDSAVWEKKHNKSEENQEHPFQITNDGVVYDIDQSVKRPNTCRLLKIDPHTDSCIAYEFEQIPRSVELYPCKLDYHYYICSDRQCWLLNLQTMQIEAEHCIPNRAILYCDMFGNAVCSHYKRTEGDFYVYGLTHYNIQSGIEIPIHEYERHSNEYLEQRAQAIRSGKMPERVVLPDHVFSKAYIDCSGNYVLLRFSTHGFKVFSLTKQKFVYENMHMQDLTNISCCDSGAFLIDNKTTYYLDLTQL